MIYTSYFANIRKLPRNCVPISIALKSPNFYVGKVYKRLAPTSGILSSYKRTGDEEAYKLSFEQLVLRHLDAKTVEQQLKDLSKGAIPVLLCYEKPDSFCHRKLVRDWFRANGVECKEFSEVNV